MTYSHAHSPSSSFSSAAATDTTASASLSSTYSPSLIPSAAPLLQPSLSTTSDYDAAAFADKEKDFTLIISSPPPLPLNENEIPPLCMADEEEESFQIHLQHEMQQKLSPTSSSCCLSLVCCSFSSPRLHIFSLFFFSISFILSLFLVYLSSSNRCSMDSNLHRMFLDVTDAFRAHQVNYFLDSGTLLGAVRDGTIIPWEFDLDVGMMEEECEKLPKLKDYFAARGYELFVRNDFVPYKENTLMGYDGYLHAPCGRIYQNAEYYTDIYWFQSVTLERRQRILHNMQQKSLDLPLVLSDSLPLTSRARSPSRPTGPSYDGVDLESYISVPWNYDEKKNGQQEWICSAEGFDANGMPGGCNILSDIQPTRPLSFLGSFHSIPARPESVLHGVYGDWQTPTPKGYKVLFCSWLPSSYMSGMAAVLSGLALAACAVQMYCQLVCGRRDLCAALLKEVKRRLDEYYA